MKLQPRVATLPFQANEVAHRVHVWVNVVDRRVHVWVNVVDHRVHVWVTEVDHLVNEMDHLDV